MNLGMTCVMARKKTTLNLTPELPEVRSTDFNLFYKPEVAPRDKSLMFLHSH